MSSSFDFASYLDDASDAVGESGQSRPGFVFDPLAISETLKPYGGPVPDSFAAAEYASVVETGEEPETPLPPEQEPVELTVDPEAIATELSLAGRDAAGLAAARRDFARGNHPDRHPAALQASALARMQIANALIDEAEKELRHLAS